MTTLNERSVKKSTLSTKVRWIEARGGFRVLVKNGKIIAIKIFLGDRIIQVGEDVILNKAFRFMEATVIGIAWPFENGQADNILFVQIITTQGKTNVLPIKFSDLATIPPSYV